MKALFFILTLFMCSSSNAAWPILGQDPGTVVYEPHQLQDIFSIVSMCMTGRDVVGHNYIIVFGNEKIKLTNPPRIAVGAYSPTIHFIRIFARITIQNDSREILDSLFHEMAHHVINVNKLKQGDDHISPLFNKCNLNGIMATINRLNIPGVSTNQFTKFDLFFIRAILTEHYLK